MEMGGGVNMTLCPAIQEHRQNQGQTTPRHTQQEFPRDLTVYTDHLIEGDVTVSITQGGQWSQ